MKMYEAILVRFSLDLVTDHRKSGIRDRIEHLINPFAQLVAMEKSIAVVRVCVCMWVHLISAL